MVPSSHHASPPLDDPHPWTVSTVRRRPDSATAARPRRGIVVGQGYRLVAPLGCGGTAEVWLAHQGDQGREVAIKLYRSRGGEGVVPHQHEREARIASCLHSPHVARVIERGHHLGQPYMVMERLDGEDLQQRSCRRRLSLEEVGHVVQGVAHALAEAHGRGIIHRDIKPANIFLSQSGGREVVKLLDFGIASIGAEDPQSANGAVVGTPRYMSPEQCRGGRVDRRSDLWSLAVVAYAALTGHHPFEGDSLGATLVAIVNRPIPLASALVPELPASIDAFFRRALRRDATQRHPTAEAFGRDFRRAMAGLAAEETDEPPPTVRQIPVG